MGKSDILLEVRNLKKYFPASRTFRSTQWVKAVDGVDFFLRQGETLGLVGESGCGKTTLGRLILRLEEPTGGEVLFEGENILLYKHEKLRSLRKEMQIIFQDPYSSLNPYQTVGNIIEEPFLLPTRTDKKRRREQVLSLLEVVGLLPSHYHRYPHEFSGGQRQRIGIARALALNPKLLICDEPVSALDVSIQAQVINLLEDLQDKFGLTYIFIAHDLNVVEHVSDRVAVMYLGRIVELSSSEQLYESPLHPYTEALFSAAPEPDPSIPQRQIILEGDVPSPLHSPPGCHFNTRCPYVIEQCRKEPPPVLEEFTPGHSARCWRVREIRKM